MNFINCLKEWQYARMQSHYEKLLKQFKNKKRIKIVFLNCSSAKWAYQYIYEQFANDDRFEVQVLVSVYSILLNKKYSHLNYKKDLEENYAFFKKLGVNVEYAFDFKKSKPLDLKNFKPDIVFYDEPQSITKNQSIDKTYKYALPLYCSYGSCISNGENEINQDYRKLYTYFVDNPFIKELLIKNGFRDKQVCIAGQPKLDAYLKPIDPENVLWKTNNKRIIYAPHFSFDKQTVTRFGTFDWNYKYFYNLAKNHPEFEFIFKPHPSLKREIIKRKLMTAEETEKYFQMWASLPNAQVFEAGNYIDMFRTSDLLITDCNSFLYEYLPTTKPVIQLINPNSVGHNEFGLKIIKGYYKAKTVDDIERNITSLLKQYNDILLKKRMDIIKKYINLSESSTAQKVYNFVYREGQL